MTTKKGEIVFRRTKGNFEDCDPDMWNDNALVTAYDNAVYKLEKVEMPHDASSQTSDNENMVTCAPNFGEVVWSRHSDIHDKPTQKKKQKGKKKRRKRHHTPQAETSKRSSMWKVGDKCMALYEIDNMYYPATITSFCDQQTVIVNFSDYDEDGTVEIGDIHPRSLWENAGIEVSTQSHKKLTETESDEILHDDNLSENESISAEPSIANPKTVHKKKIPHDNFALNTPGLPLDIELPMFPNIKHTTDFSNHCNMGKNGFDHKEPLSSMLVSWYMAGYHTGFYRGLNSATAKKNMNNHKI